ncbi:MAG: sorbitol dehydrogenase family protein [Glaciimonas sp.]|nr:sorbitol dehydrogenase family protein [Glaciimonas sp.]
MTQRPSKLPSSFSSPSEKNSSSSLGSPSLTRRNLLLLAGGSFAVMSAPRWLQQATAQNSVTQVLPASGQANNPQQADFLALSALLTANQKLQPQTSARTYAALSAQVPEFEKQASALWQFAQTHKIKEVEALVIAVADKPELKVVLHTIVSAWYLGQVGGGAQGKVIAFDSALMFDPVRDAVVVPTYCRAAPGYWVTQPAVLKARV